MRATRSDRGERAREEDEAVLRHETPHGVHEGLLGVAVPSLAAEVVSRQRDESRHPGNEVKLRDILRLWVASRSEMLLKSEALQGIGKELGRTVEQVPRGKARADGHADVTDKGREVGRREVLDVPKLLPQVRYGRDVEKRRGGKADDAVPAAEARAGAVGAGADEAHGEREEGLKEEGAVEAGADNVGAVGADADEVGTAEGATAAMSRCRSPSSEAAADAGDEQRERLGAGEANGVEERRNAGVAGGVLLLILRRTGPKVPVSSAALKTLGRCTSGAVAAAPTSGGPGSNDMRNAAFISSSICSCAKASRGPCAEGTKAGAKGLSTKGFSGETADVQGAGGMLGARSVAGATAIDGDEAAEDVAVTGAVAVTAKVGVVGVAADAVTASAVAGAEVAEREVIAGAGAVAEAAVVGVAEVAAVNAPRPLKPLRIRGT